MSTLCVQPFAGSEAPEAVLRCKVADELVVASGTGSGVWIAGAHVSRVLGNVVFMWPEWVDNALIRSWVLI